MKRGIRVVQLQKADCYCISKGPEVMWLGAHLHDLHEDNV